VLRTRPSGPPAEPAGNNRTAFRTSDSSIDRQCCGWGAGRSVKTLEDGGCFSRSALKECGKGAAGLSSDIRRRIAALTLPSSSFAETAWLIVEVELNCRWALWVGLAESLSGWPTEYEAIRCLIADARLWRFPPRFGACRTVSPQIQPLRSWVRVGNNFTQHCRQMGGTGRSSRFRYMFDNCRIRWQPDGQWLSGISDKTALGKLALELDTEWSVGVGVWLLAWSGGLLDLGHGSCWGPCLWILPPRMWTCWVAKHMLHVPLGLLISCERGQFCYILSEHARD